MLDSVCKAVLIRPLWTHIRHASSPGWSADPSPPSSVGTGRGWCPPSARRPTGATTPTRTTWCASAWSPEPGWMSTLTCRGTLSSTKGLTSSHRQQVHAESVSTRPIAHICAQTAVRSIQVTAVRTGCLPLLRVGHCPCRSNGHCSGEDSRNQATTTGRVVGDASRVGGCEASSTTAVMDHPGQPESETAAEIPSLGQSDERSDRMRKTVAKMTLS